MSVSIGMRALVMQKWYICKEIQTPEYREPTDVRKYEMFQTPWHITQSNNRQFFYAMNAHL